MVTKMSAFSAILLLLGLLAILYFVGQVIGCVSHLLYDRLFVRNVIGYPFQYILDLKPRPDDSVRITYLFLVVFVAQLLFVPIIYELLCRLGLLTSKGGWKMCVVWLSIAFLLFFVSFIFRIILVFTRMKRMDSREHYIKRADENSIEKDDFMVKTCNILTRCAWYLFYPIRKLTSTDTKVHQSIRDVFFKRMKDETGLDLRKQVEYNSDAYWLTYISLTKKDPRHDVKINNWLNLYGCLRNYSCAFLILSSVISTRQWLCIYQGEISLPDSFCLLTSLVLCLILFVRYWIIYFSYYTKYIIRAYAVESELLKK